ncbi:hypothetical protein PV682_23970 [Streptomyces niveiscabiei]|uniref:hypothetical protein n=1 Tax=Streptomyces niveiscabiei TaxID=164115 RepID=UPI0029B6450D|nr:hypothetical protein [Streptomyces niveiscabiei]MDX3384497.1 hypothetical protein [Streptomyces niveiscabiei]
MTDLPRLLADALALPDPDAGAEAEALAAFRVARDSGALRAPTRRCDDWRREGDEPCGGGS